MAADGIEGIEDSVLRLARERGFDKCPVCLELVIFESAITACGHKFCVSCLHECFLRRRSSSDSFLCPVCRAPCEGRPLLCRDLFREVRQFTCPAEECDNKSMSLSDFEEHIWYACPSREIECKCGNGVVASAYAIHCQKSHPGTGAERSCCSSCGKNELSSLLKAHEEFCGLIRCPSCSLYCRNDKLPEHVGKCIVNHYVCQYTGCGYRAEIGELYFHISVAHRPKIFEDWGLYRQIDPQLLFLGVADAVHGSGVSLSYVFFESPCEQIKKVRLLGLNKEEWISFSSPRILNSAKVLRRLREEGQKFVERVTFPILHDYPIRQCLASGMLCETDVKLLIELEEISLRFSLLVDDPADLIEAFGYTLANAENILKRVEF